MIEFGLFCLSDLATVISTCRVNTPELCLVRRSPTKHKARVARVARVVRSGTEGVARKVLVSEMVR